MIKRVQGFFCVLILMIAFWTNPVSANAITYDIGDLDLQVTIPLGYSVITRDTSAHDPIFNALGTTRSVIMDQFETNNIYMNAISDTYNEEIVVTMQENSLSNFSLLSDTVLETAASMLVDQYKDYGISVLDYEIYQHSQAKFIKLYFVDDGETVHGLQYYTIYDGKAMNFTMRSYEGDLSLRQEETIETIVDSISYDKEVPVAEQEKETEAFIYSDSESDVTFTVPANWRQEEFFKEREAINVKFISTKEEGCVIIYGSTDMWEQLSESEKRGYTRADLNNSLFTNEDIAQMCNTTAENITTVVYNGVKYYKGEPQYTSDAYGMDITVTMTQLVYIDNGWIHTFQFGGPSTHKMYSDFECLMNSVQYSVESNKVGSKLDNKAYNSEDLKRIIVLVPLIIGGIAVVVTVSSRKKKRKDIDYAKTYTPVELEKAEILDQIIICKSCGQTLSLDNVFCHVCGTKVIKETKENE